MMFYMSDLSRMNSMKIRPLTSILSGHDNLKTDLSRTILSRLNEKFIILTLILNAENDQMASSRLDEVFRILTLILNDEDDEPGSTSLTCLALVIISSGHR